MAAMQRYYNRTVCVPEEGEKLRLNQRVIITRLDEVITPKKRRIGTLERKGTVSFLIVAVSGNASCIMPGIEYNKIVAAERKFNKRRHKAA